MAKNKKTFTIGAFDEQYVDRLFRKSAFLATLSSQIYIKEVSGWLADFEEVEIPAPLTTRTQAAQLAAKHHATFEQLIDAGDKLGLREFFRGLMDGNWRHLDKIRGAFKHAEEYNAKIMRRLTFGQYASATVGLAAGAGLIVLGTAGSLVILTAGTAITEATVFGMAIGGGSGAFTGTAIVTNISIAAARSWDDCESWDGLAVGGQQALTEAQRLALNTAADKQAEKFLQASLNSSTWGGAFKNIGKALAAKSVGAGLAIVFASSDLVNEVKYFKKSIESPGQRQQRLHKTRR